MNRQIAGLAVFAVLAFNPSVMAAEEQSSSPLAEELSSRITQHLSEKIPNAQIKLPSLARLAATAPLSDISVLNNTRLLEDRSNGIVTVEVIGTSEGGREIRQLLQTPYEAWVDVPVAIKRVYPNTKLSAQDFKTQSVNVASGMAREYRGVMVEADTDFSKLESRQTILEGQFVTRSAIQRQPDLRKGEMVKLELISGDLSLVTQAVVQEPASIGDRVRVLTLKTKKEITGKIRPDHSVEVSL